MTWPIPKPAQRWSIQRKRDLLEGMLAHKIAPSEVCAHYGFSIDELTQMLARYQAHGIVGLKIKYLQEFR
jgi:hypothetical protein